MTETKKNVDMADPDTHTQKKDQQKNLPSALEINPLE